MMNITKREYAQKVANFVGGEVKEVEKANGIIYTGIQFPSVDGIAPVFYIDDDYNAGKEVLITVAELEKKYESEKENMEFSMDSVSKMVMNFNNVKDMLRLRLVNKKTKVEVFRDAEQYQYGFKDLIVYPAIILSGNESNASIKVTNGLINEWSKAENKDVTDDVFRIAIENMEREAEIYSMFDALVGCFGFEKGTDEYEEAKRDYESNMPMRVVSNRSKLYGASCILTKKVKSLLPEKFVVLPSSVHEVIVLPFNDEVNMDAFCTMVKEVNETQVAPTEVLGDRAYVIVND